MIVEILYKSKTEGSVKLIKRFSDKGLKIRKVGTDEHFDEAIDVVDAPFVYEETNIATESE